MVMKSVTHHLSKCGLKLPSLLGTARQPFKRTSSSGSLKLFFFLLQDFSRLGRVSCSFPSFLPILTGDGGVSQGSEHLLEIIRH